MTLAEWNSIQRGDFLILDSCSLEPPLFQGRVILTVNNKAAFRGKIKEKSLKILELPLLQEMRVPIQETHPLTRKAETAMSKPTNDEDEDDLSDLEFTDAESFALEESFLEEEKTEESEATDQAEAAKNPALEAAPSKLFTPGEIPVNVTVEVGRIQMTMDQLLRLEPGNLLEVDTDPANGVDLTINGKTVGRGELLKIGEAIGVRILELG
jgi:flagellar motor switch protein FliN/FliY